MKTETEIKAIIESAEQELFELRKVKIKALFEEFKHKWLICHAPNKVSYFYLRNLSTAITRDSIFTYVEISELQGRYTISIEKENFYQGPLEDIGDGFISFCGYHVLADVDMLRNLNKMLEGFLSIKER